MFITATYGVDIKLEQLQIHGLGTQWALPTCSLPLTFRLPAENCLNVLFPGPSPPDRGAGTADHALNRGAGTADRAPNRGTGTADHAPMSFQQQQWDVRRNL